MQGEARGQRSGSQRQAGPQRVQQWLPPALQKLQGAWPAREAGPVGEVGGIPREGGLARAGEENTRAEGRGDRGRGEAWKDAIRGKEGPSCGDGDWSTARRGRDLRGAGAGPRASQA